jgi:ribosomal protein S18 acetylase RimI-like enzyme
MGSVGPGTRITAVYSSARLTRKLIEPKRDQILRFCAQDPVERVFLEDVARRGLGRFVGLAGDDGELRALCHLGVNVVPSGADCGVFARDATRAAPRMLIGEERAVSDLWEAAHRDLPTPREDRPGQPVFVIREAPAAGATGLREATLDDLELLLPACAAAHAQELGLDPLQRDAEGFRWRTRTQIEEDRSWLWVEDGVILFKAEASAWTPEAVQLQQVWVDPGARRHGNGARGLSDLCGLLLEHVPTVCLFVRADNHAAIRLYEAIGMEHVLDYRSLLF